MSSIRSYNANNSTIIPPKRKARRASDTEQTAVKREDLYPPVKRGYQVVPTLAVLQKAIEKALLALQNGIYWERGSIINIVI